MNPLNRWLRLRPRAWWNHARQASPRLFIAGVLMAAVFFAVGHYTFGEWVTYPRVALWKERAFWADVPSVVCVPLLHWGLWTLVSLGRLKPAPVILAAAITLCLADLGCYLVWINITSFDFDFKIAVDYWDWWTYWTPGVMLAGNLVLLRQWLKLVRRTTPRTVRALTGTDLALRAAAALLGSCAALMTAIHLVVPRSAINNFTLSTANVFLLQPEWKQDFDFVVQNSVSRGKRLGALLEHAELAHLQRRHFYADLDQLTYQEFVLSPVIDRLPLSELDWRRTLWEHFYPRVRNQHDPTLAAQTVVRYLRERVGIDSTFAYRVGVETIWTQQSADEIGFERVYVAALRSVGIAARLSEVNRAEIWADNAWHKAPRPIIENWSSRKEVSH